MGSWSPVASHEADDHNENTAINTAGDTQTYVYTMKKQSLNMRTCMNNDYACSFMNKIMMYERIRIQCNHSTAFVKRAELFVLKV